MKFCNNKKITTDKDQNQILTKMNCCWMILWNKIKLKLKEEMKNKKHQFIVDSKTKT